MPSLHLGCRLQRGDRLLQMKFVKALSLLEVDEIKTIPCTPASHTFVERLIGTVRREYLDWTLFWNSGDLERKLDNYKTYYNQHQR